MTIDYTEEIRFGVVMYGGVSLAIYINGVTNELFELACATPRLAGSVGPAGATRETYRRLSLLAGNADLRHAYAAALADPARPPDADVWRADFERAAQSQARFVIDIVAGTSAGGINGIFLAKALVNGQAFAPLARLWVQEGDIGKLLNDSEAYDGLPPDLARPDGPPASLLSSDRMYLKLLGAMVEMQPLSPLAAAGSPLVDELDLFVTTTDIRGSAVPLRLFDRVVYEKRYKQRFHFVYPKLLSTPGADARADFAPDNTAFLAFAARCTSSFPFAFEPMTLQRTSDLAGIDDARLDDWKAYFDELPEASRKGRSYLERPFGDGGYLDNKPFSYVAEALSRRFGDPPAQRKLLYVEPDPQPVDANQLARAAAPDAVSNAFDALLVIPRYETIREDLQVILRRNRRIERVETIVQLAERDIERGGNRFANVRCPNGKIPQWHLLGLRDMVAYYGESFLPYRRLRVFAVTDWLAECLARRWGVDTESDAWYALRAIVRTWREAHFAEDPAPASAHLTVNAFLDRFDLDYRIRRLGFLLRRIDQLTRLLRAHVTAAATPPVSDLEAVIRDKMQRLLGVDPTADTPARGLMIGALADSKKRLRHLHRELLRLRGLSLCGPGFTPPDDAARAEMKALLGAILGLGGQANARVTLERETGCRDVIEFEPFRAQSASAGSDLQDSVKQRAAQLAPRVPWASFKLWDAVDAAIAALRVTPDGASYTEAARVLDDAFKAIGAPALAAVEVTPKQFEAQLQVEDPPPGAEHDVQRALRCWLGEYFLMFDSFDQARFPLYYDTDTGEPAAVEVVRVSPVDASSLRMQTPEMPKLAGNAFAHFGAFLDERWRRNDILWGRLDGAERLIRTVLSGDDEHTIRVRDELTHQAQQAILKEELGRYAVDLSANLVRAVEGASAAAKPADALRAMLDRLSANEAAARRRMADLLRAFFEPEQLRTFVREQLTFDPKLPVDPSFRNAARAVHITGGVLEGVSKQRKEVEPIARWLSRVAIVVQGVVAVSLPGTFRQRWGQFGIRVVYGFEAALLLVAFVFGGAEMRQAAVAALVATAAVHLLTLVVNDYARGLTRVWRWCAVGVVTLLVACAVLGVVALRRQGLQALCEPALPASAAGRLTDFWCERR